MPPSSNLRRAWMCAVAAIALMVLAAPAGAATVPAQVPLPCVDGVPCPDPPPASKPVCANATVEPAAGNLRLVRRATLCLLNRERAKRDLGRLRSNGALQGVASRYAKRMAEGDFFDHTSPTGSTFLARILQSPYVDPGDGYTLGENLGWGSGALATPQRIVRAWMDSPGHRANILKGAYEDIGIGIVPGTPVAGGGPGATYVNEFGTRS